MKIHQISTLVCLSFGTLLAFSPSVKAATFQTNYTSSLSNTDASKGDIWLSSITQNGKEFNNFSLGTRADILENTPITDVKADSTSTPGSTNNNTGAASTDQGDLAYAPISVSGLKDPTGAEIATFLGNKNLNNIIDTEDGGVFKINLFFNSSIQEDSSGLDNLFFWERGMNSDLGIQGIDSSGNLIGNFLKLNHQDQADAGYKIKTTEIGDAQQVGSWGVKLQQLGVTSLSGIQLTAEASFNGPDFKLLARSSQISAEQVPEPSTTAALGFLAVIAVRTLRKKANFIV
ncbi:MULTISPECIES: exosortase-dependent surface protein XDP2 [unclassified Tolypothrix]|uniref:exosortase-dependent surface protein XDP2 n=1 Tax=unclassified Tolypothrix TaxID=2649714 RepID=UPI0005EABD19|nr:MULTISPECIES: exosortase-dependent surface protein XDP2 [unclassified Tolypothrix]BAY94620.1 hypothetical protein NIES3275_66720 [Microchaete diplosiphon NIES-3275]EKE99168.1 PEP-CTERM putative exosortase interaction domain protein [Tolypothrix sp. PCC 7601]MBE9081969.1 PEP-CTERM sorting domain-containing protein [Tolypothrix sp. LEGE 11397]UYD28320.1 PEP-CTERM sorting domain-containing protein [Tolypothrix sp. PCC 7712]UYD35805.1 PEP-CTERM sorting domain-containing protein [Tolypothrix sp.